MDVTQMLSEHYANYDEEGRLLSQHGRVEYLTTMHYIEKYLRSGMRILEIGAGTGRYSHTLAKRGWQVDAVELVPHNIEIFREKTLPNEPVTIRQGNATDLHWIPDNTYDVTLLLGPMYHLFTEVEKLQALSEAIRVTKSSGIIFAAYCGNDATIIQFCFRRGMLKQKHYRELIDLETFKAGSDPAELFELHRKEDIDGLMSHFAVERLHYVGTDMVTNHMRQEVDEMDEELFALFLKYHLAICERPDMVGISHHILDIFRK